jgi:hypothetical protein
MDMKGHPLKSTALSVVLTGVEHSLQALGALIIDKTMTLA